nr:hypothetical protein [uncultured Cohaesibacter sp.]
MTEPVQTILGVKLAHLVAGFFGGLVRAIINPHGSKAYTVGATICGTLTAGYLTPIAVPLVVRYFGASAVGVEGAVGFLMGLCGLAIAEGIVTLARRWKDNPSLPRFPPKKNCEKD